MGKAWSFFGANGSRKSDGSCEICFIHVHGPMKIKTHDVYLFFLCVFSPPFLYAGNLEIS